MRLLVRRALARLDRRAGLWTGLHAVLVTCVLAANSPPAGAADVALVVREAHGVYDVHGEFTAAVPQQVAWDVLSDYEHIGEFVHSVRSSRLVTSPGGHRVLRQQASAGFFPFRRTIRVELALAEDPGRRITFRDVLGRDFRHYAGAWTLRHGPAGTEVAYELAAEPRTSAPALLGRGVMAHGARDLLTQVRAEMLRRAALPGRADAGAARH